MIYLDNAATTMHKPKEVIDAVVEAMTSLCLLYTSDAADE